MPTGNTLVNGFSLKAGFEQLNFINKIDIREAVEARVCYSEQWLCRNVTDVSVTATAFTGELWS